MNEERKGFNPYRALADRTRLSEPTIRKAFSREAITWRTAKVLSNALEIPVESFCVKMDGRGRNGGIRK